MNLTYIGQRNSYLLKSETPWFSSKITMDPNLSIKPCVVGYAGSGRQWLLRQSTNLPYLIHDSSNSLFITRGEDKSYQEARHWSDDKVLTYEPTLHLVTLMLTFPLIIDTTLEVRTKATKRPGIGLMTKFWQAGLSFEVTMTLDDLYWTMLEPKIRASTSVELTSEKLPPGFQMST